MDSEPSPTSSRIRPRGPAAARSAVGLWATRQRCPSEASGPQPWRRGRRSCRRATPPGAPARPAPDAAAGRCRRRSRPQSRPFRYTSSYLSERHSRSMNTLSSQRPRPSIEILIPAANSLPVKDELVNCEPWSVLKISGRPNRASTSSKASMQKLVSTACLRSSAGRSRPTERRHSGTARPAGSPSRRRCGRGRAPSACAGRYGRSSP